MTRKVKRNLGAISAVVASALLLAGTVFAVIRGYANVARDASQGVEALEKARENESDIKTIRAVSKEQHTTVMRELKEIKDIVKER